MKKLLFTYCLIIVSWSMITQSHPEDQIKDTIMFEGKRIIRYMDYSWEYLKVLNQNSAQEDKKEELLARTSTIDTNKLFSWRWYNNKTFSRDIRLSNMSDTVKINLISPYNPKVNLPQTGVVTSRYGPRWGKMHKGIDLGLRTGDNVHAAFGGKVRYARYNAGGYGNLVIIRHYNGLETYYGHLSSFVVKENQYVQSGDIIGKGGNTGHSTGAHLHFECRYLDNAFDPEIIFDFVNQKLKITELFLFAEIFKDNNNSESVDIKPQENVSKEEYIESVRRPKKLLKGNINN